MGELVRLAAGGRGRGIARVVAMSEDIVEPHMELVAQTEAAADFADVVLATSRAIQRALARGHLMAAGMLADELEQIAPRVALRARLATSVAKERLAELEGIGCVDAIAAPGHGQAA